MDWFLYDKDLRHERVKCQAKTRKRICLITQKLKAKKYLLKEKLVAAIYSNKAQIQIEN